MSAPAATAAPFGASRVPSRRPDIQGLRALAILLVVVFHAGLPLPGGFVGVDVFFVISGFVITRLLVAELETRGRIDFGRFYQGRIRRLLPALAVTTTAVALLGMLVNPIGTQVTAAHTGIAASLFAANGYLYRSAPGYFSPGSDFNPLLHTWSLAVEEQYYFLFPLTLAVAWRLFGPAWPPLARRRGLAVLVGLLLGASFLVSWAMSYGNPLMTRLSAPAQFAFYAPVTRAWEFAVGALLALAPAWQARLPARTALALSLLGLALLAGSGLWIDGHMPFPGLVAPWPIAGIALLIVGGGSGDHVVRRWLGSRPLTWIGDRSYGWYLWHWPLVVFARTLVPESTPALVVASLVALGFAALSYRWIETPLRAQHRPVERGGYLLGAVCIAVPIAAFGLLLLAHRALLAAPQAQPIAAALALHADTTRGCEGLAALRPGPAQCRWPIANARGEVILVGDSNAGQLTEALIGAAHAAGLGLVVATRPACPFVDVGSYDYGAPNVACREFVRGALEEIRAQRPRLVIVVTAADGYIEAASTTLQDPAAGPVATTPEAKAPLWTEGTSRVLAALDGIAPVVVVPPVPRFPTWTLAACPAYRVLWNPQGCATAAPRTEIEAARRRTVAAIDAAVARHPHATTLDLVASLCSDASCDVRRGDVWRYRDGAHLSVPGARELAPEFEAAIRSRALP